MSDENWLRELAPHWDNWDSAALVLLLIVAAIGWLGLLISALPAGWNAPWLPSVPLPTPAHSIALLTACTVFYGQYRLRHPTDKRNVPAVRPEYEDAYSSEATGYGLKNFGPGPALFLQIKARTSTGDEEILLRPHDSPTHLEEGKFLSLTDDQSRSNDETLHSLIDGADGDSEIQFYYSYVSQAGAREPVKATRLAEQDDEDILEQFPMDDQQEEDVRSIDISKLRRHLKPELEAGR